MFVKFTEAYEDTTHYNNAIGKKQWCTREVVVNTDYISSLTPDNRVSQYTEQDKSPFKEGQAFTRISLAKNMNGYDIIVLGTLEDIAERLNNSKRVLKG